MPHERTRFINLPIILLICLAFALGCSEFIMLGVTPDVARSLEVPLASVGNLVGLFAGTYAVCTPVLGIATGRFRRYHLLLAYLVVYNIGNLLAAIAPVYAVLLVARVLTASVSGPLLAVGMTFVADLAPLERQPIIISWIFSGFSIAAVLGVPAGTAICSLFGWHAAFAVAFALAAVLSVALGVTMPRTGSTDVPAGVRTQLALFGEGRVLACMAISIFCAAGTYVFYTFISAYLKSVLGMNPVGISTFLMAMGASSLISNLASGVIAARWGMPGLIPAGVAQVALLLGIGAAGGLLSIACVLIFLLGVVMYLQNSPLISVFLGIARDAHPGSETLASSLQPMSFNIGIALGSAVGGAVVSGPGLALMGPVGAILAAISLALCCAYVMLAGRKA